MKEILTESYRTVKKVTGIDPSKPGNLKQLLTDDKAFKTYVASLAESIEDKKDRKIFAILAENTRVNLMENSMFQINPYESLTLPILRVFYPKLVAKEAVTVSPMDKPECVKTFIRASFTPSNDTTSYPAPVLTPDVSGGPSAGIPVAAPMPVPNQNFNVLHVIDPTDRLTKNMVHLERDFTIVAVSDGTTEAAQVIVPAVEGHFSGSVSIGTDTDVISGMVDYLNCTVSISSATGLVQSVKFTVTCSLEENQVNPKMTLVFDKIRLYAKDRQIQANWTLTMEQDVRALFDVSIQAEIVNLLGQQIALDIDRELIFNLLNANTKLNESNHTGSFDRTPPTDYTWGAKYWHENILVPLNQLSAQIYSDTHIDAANTIVANPIDVAIFEDINGFAYTGTSSVNGDVGYRSATVQGGKWKILTSAVVPQGQMVVLYVPTDEIKAIYFYAPYVPAVLHPFPLGYTPALTILSRYATSLVRPLGIGAMTILH